MKPDKTDFDVLFGILNDNGEIREVKLVGHLEDVEESKPNTDLSKKFAEEIYTFYESFKNAGFEENQAYGLTRDLFKCILRGKNVNVEED